MSKIVILLCVVVVASVDAYVKDQFEVVEDRIKFVIDNGIKALETKFNSMLQIVRENEAKLWADHISNVENISAEIGYIDRKAWDVINDFKVNAPIKCDREKNRGGYDCSKTISEAWYKGWKSFISVTKCSGAAWSAVWNIKVVSETTMQYHKAYSDLIKLRNKPLCSGQYNKTTEFDFITWCNEMLYRQINEEINNKHPLVLAKIDDTKKILPTLLSGTIDCRSYWNKTAFQANIEKSIRKSKECFKRCQLEEQMQTSTAANIPKKPFTTNKYNTI